MTIVVTDNRNTLKVGGSSVAYIEYTFMTDGSGNASETIDREIFGLVQRVVTKPDSVVPPTANWDLTILDEDGADVLGGHGLDRDSGGIGAVEQCVPEILLCACASKLTFTIANGGSATKGTVRLYLV